MKDTSIEWAHHTVNHWWGCDRVSPGCAHCYAAELDQRFHGGAHWRGQRKPRLEAATKEALALDRKAARLGIRYRVFALSMGDWLDPKVPIVWLATLLDTIRQTPNLDWLLLTKRPELWRERLRAACGYAGQRGETELAWSDTWGFAFDWYHGHPPENVWIGTTVEDQTRADLRIPELLRIPAAVRFLSCEPLLGPVVLPLGSHQFCPECEGTLKYGDNGPGYLGNTEYHACDQRPASGIHWVICGGESGKQARPMHPDWARSLRDQCQAADVPFFFKQWGEWVALDQSLECLARRDAGENPGFYGMRRDGSSLTASTYSASDACVYCFGKKAAGRRLDGHEHNAFPSASSAPSAVKSSPPSRPSRP